MTITKIKEEYTEIQFFDHDYDLLFRTYVVFLKVGDISFPIQSCSDLKSACAVRGILVKAIQRIIEEAK